MEMYAAGEELFALRPLQYPEAARMKRDIALLEQLYTLYADALQQLQQWCATPWRRVRDSLAAAATDAAALELRWRKLPRRLREWKACEDLRAVLQNFIDVRMHVSAHFSLRSQYVRMLAIAKSALQSLMKFTCATQLLLAIMVVGSVHMRHMHMPHKYYCYAANKHGASLQPQQLLPTLLTTTTDNVTAITCDYCTVITATTTAVTTGIACNRCTFPGQHEGASLE
eukprot:1322-Heterococcus_DN1.PRE.1